ncbi:MAG TPA: radical SAM protein [Clostridiaceae bacterium]|nr:radical SAM protein [Clostridiaceae bacterium]
MKELKIEVTQKCPLNCIHCSSEANISKERQIDELTVVHLLSDSSKLGVTNIVFSGGEPLVWEPLYRCLTICNEYGFNTTVYTTCNNFYGNNKLLYEFISTGVKNVVVSLFGATQKEHDKITRKYGSFDKTISGIKMLSEAGIDVSIHFVAMKPNWKQLADVISLIQKLKVRKISILRFVPHGRGKIVKDIYNLNKDELKELKSEIMRLRENTDVSIRLGSPFNILSLQSDVDCTAGIDRLIIGSDGKIYPCDAFKNITHGGKFSSIYEGSLIDIWNNSEYLNDVREKVSSGLNQTCKLCEDRTKCKGGCLAQKIIRFKGEYDLPDPDCLKSKQEGIYEQLKL